MSQNTKIATGWRERIKHMRTTTLRKIAHAAGLVKKGVRHSRDVLKEKLSDPKNRRRAVVGLGIVTGAGAVAVKRYRKKKKKYSPRHLIQKPTGRTPKVPSPGTMDLDEYVEELRQQEASLSPDRRRQFYKKVFHYLGGRDEEAKKNGTYDVNDLGGRIGVREVGKRIRSPSTMSEAEKTPSGSTLFVPMPQDGESAKDYAEIVVNVFYNELVRRHGMKSRFARMYRRRILARWKSLIKQHPKHGMLLGLFFTEYENAYEIGSKLLTRSSPMTDTKRHKLCDALVQYMNSYGNDLSSGRIQPTISETAAIRTWMKHFLGIHPKPKSPKK